MPESPPAKKKEDNNTKFYEKNPVKRLHISFHQTETKKPFQEYRGRGGYNDPL